MVTRQQQIHTIIHLLVFSEVQYLRNVEQSGLREVHHPLLSDDIQIISLGSG
jgi:hypothetical protein